MSAASFLEANSVSPSLCWDSRWPPRWTVSAHILDSQAACAELHTSPSTCCLSFSQTICCDTDLLALMHPCLSVLPRDVIHSITPASNCVTLCLCIAAMLPPPLTSPFLLSSLLLCCVTLASARRCRMPRAALSPTKEGMMEWYPISYNASSPSFQEPVQNCSPWICSWLPHGLCLSLLPTAALSAYLTPAFSLSRPFSCATSHHLE